MIRVATIGLLAGVLAGCMDSPEGGRRAGVLVFAASSTTHAMAEVIAAFESETGLDVTASFASSAMLARQIEAGAGASVFLSANRDWVEYLDGEGLIATRRDLLRNGLVLIVRDEEGARVGSPDDLAAEDVERVALADPESVPAGKYGVAALRALGLWDVVEPKVLPAGDVRQALLYVEYGQADAGIVYATDALASGRVRVVAELDGVLEEPVMYSLALLADHAANPAGQRFYHFLASGEAGAIFRSFGFEVLESE